MRIHMRVYVSLYIYIYIYMHTRGFVCFYMYGYVYVMGMACAPCVYGSMYICVCALRALLYVYIICIHIES